MASPGSVTIVPSVHFSPSHRRRVRETIRDERPDLVAVELGDRRFDRLDRRTGGPDLNGLTGPAAAAYLTLRTIQRSVVRLYGLDPETTDMETAVETAAELDLDVALIDDPIDETVGALARRVGPMSLPRSFLRAQRLSPSERIARLELLSLPFEDVEHGDDVQPLVEHVRELFPELADVLVDRRDHAMAERLDALRRRGHDVVAIVGAAHHNGIERRLTELADREAAPDRPVPIVTPSMDVTRIRVS
ncbi:TraB domain-containing protein [Halovivax sp.]|uniref:TraB domain-containing protein n=1 Tax=Halovivax sp. TaxID=1935978 RepID=UPI0025BFC5C7|nr:TraB domain-containing protein [Halovivax sp.]